MKIVKEYFNVKSLEEISKPEKGDSFFYIIRIHQERKRWLKIGTAKNVVNRFKYYEYKIDEIFYIAEIEGEKDNLKYEIYYRNRLTVERKGFRFVKNDRFTYFSIPSDLFDLIREYNKDILMKDISKLFNIFVLDYAFNIKKKPKRDFENFYNFCVSHS